MVAVQPLLRALATLRLRDMCKTAVLLTLLREQ